MITDKELAALSLYVYPSDGENLNAPLLLDWQVRQNRTEGSLGFAYAIFQKAVTNEVVIAFRGTDANLVTDFLTNLGAVISQEKQAAAVYAQALSTYGGNITFTGHSMGGGLAATMAVWFNRPAVVFDPAPTQTVATTLAVVNSVIGMFGGASAPLSIRDYAAALDTQFATRENNVTSYFAPGSFVQLASTTANTVTGAGAGYALQFGADKMAAADRLLDLHKQSLLTAGMLAPQSFPQSTVAVQWALPMVFDEDLYHLREDLPDRNFLVDIIRSEQQLPGNGKIANFAADLHKLGATLQGLTDVAQKAIVAQGIEWYYWQGTGYAGEDFLAPNPSQPSLLQYTTAVGAGLASAENKAAAYANQWLTPIAIAHKAFGGEIAYAQWSVATGAQGSVATARDAAKTQLFIGSTGADVFTGGNVNDKFFAGAGNDSLTGDAGNDQIYGGTGTDTLFGGIGNDSLAGGIGNDSLFGEAGDDTYYYDAGTGNDTITDSDDLGAIFYRPASGTSFMLRGGVRLPGDSAGVFHSYTVNPGTGQITFDSKFTYTVVGTDLQIGITGEAGTITVKNFNSGDLRLMLNDHAHTPSVIQGTAGSDWAVPGGANLSLQGSANADEIQGLAGLDDIYGNGGDDKLYGGADSDLIYGGTGNDVLDGGTGPDDLIGEAGADILIGGAGMDVLTGDLAGMGAGAGDDYLDGGADADNLVAGGGNDILFGGDGDDFLDGDANTTPALYHGNDFLDGGAGADELIGSGGEDTLFGGAGNDQLYGDAAQGVHGDDYLDGGSGNDELYGYGGDDQLLGGADHDSLYGAEGADSLDGGPGNDTLWGDAGDDLLSGGSGTNLLYGGDGDDTYVIEASATTTVLDLAGSNSFRFGGGLLWGNLTLRTEPNGTLVLDFGNAATLRIQTAQQNFQDVFALLGETLLEFAPLVGEEAGLLVGSSELAAIGFDLSGTAATNSLVGTNVGDRIAGLGGNDTLQGGDGNDELSGGDGIDDLHGGNGDDTLDGGGAPSGWGDILRGGAGNDTYTSSNSSDATIELANEGMDTLVSSLSYTQLPTNIENLQLTGQAATVYDLGRYFVAGYGNASDNRIDGNAQDNYLAGADGNDQLYGGEGNDILSGLQEGIKLLSGGPGNDWYLVDDANDVVIETPSDGTDTAYGYGLALVLAANVENGTLLDLLNGTPVISMSGNELDNVLLGNSAGNLLFGNSGSDTLMGGPGNDTLDGGTGSGRDIVDYSLATVPVTAELWRGSALNDGEGGQDTLMNVEGLFGTAFNDLLAGTHGNEVLVGNAGDDGLYAADGTDSLMGGAGNDTMDGGTGIDVVDYVGATGAVTAELWRGFATNDGQGLQDALWNIEYLLGSTFNDLLAGTTGDNYLGGHDGADQLYGGLGNDTLAGGRANDSLNGSAGLDAFVFDTALDSTNVDHLQDFSVVDDAVWLENAVFTALVSTGTLGAGLLRAGAGVTTAADGNDFILYNSSTGALFYDADGSGTGTAPVQFALLGTGLALTVADFVVI